MRSADTSARVAATAAGRRPPSPGRCWRRGGAGRARGATASTRTDTARGVAGRAGGGDGEARRNPLVGSGRGERSRWRRRCPEVALDAGQRVVDPAEHRLGREGGQAATERGVQRGGRLVEQVAGQAFQRRHQAVVQVDQRDEQIAGTEPEQIVDASTVDGSAVRPAASRT